MMDYLETFSEDKIDATLKDRNLLASFYEEFLNSSRDMQSAMDYVDAKLQQEMVEESFAFFLNLYKLGNTFPEYNELARQHSQMQNVGADMYDKWMNSVIEAVEAGDPKIGSEVLQSWKEAVAPGVEFMKNMSPAQHA